MAGALCQRRSSYVRDWHSVLVRIAAPCEFARNGEANRWHMPRSNVGMPTVRHARTINGRLNASEQQPTIETLARLAGGIAHDFNHLLTVITWHTEALLEKLADTDPLMLDAYEIQRAALSAAGLASQLMSLGSDHPRQPEAIDVNRVVARTADILRRTFPENIDVIVTLDPQPMRIMGHAGHIEQIVLNLAINARDAMTTGGRLTLTTLRHGDCVRLAVADNGSGIPAAIQSQVFEPQFSTKGTEGHGFGLATVRDIVQQSGGQIHLASTPGVGTTVTIDMPGAPERLPADGVASSPLPRPDGCATVLIVDDDPHVRQLVEVVLRRVGYHVVSVTGPRDALAAVHRGTGFHLVLTDIVMPGMSGYDLAAAVRKIAPGARIAFMSGFADAGVREPSSDPFLAKPFTVESLTTLVQQALAV